MERPPVAAPFIPGRSRIGVLARFAFWPLAFVGARAISAGNARIIGPSLILAALGASSLAGARSRRVAGGGAIIASVVVGIASFAAAHAALLRLGPTTALLLAVASALAAAVSFARTLVAVRAHAAPSLDADALALAPAATWLFICSLLMGFGAEATHEHVAVPLIARGLAVIACGLAAVAVVTLARQRAWTARVYRGEAPPLAIARVPANEAVLVQRYAARTRAAALSLALALAALAGGAYAGVTHSADGAAVPRRLPSLPEACAAAPPKLRFVPLSPLRLIDIEDVAARYRSAGLVVSVDAPLVFEERFHDPKRGQLIGEEIAHAALASRAPQAPSEFVVVMTDRDMFLRSVDWRFAFAYRQDQVSVVSLARMDPRFPWLEPRRYAPSRPACAVDLRARAFKMITRQIALQSCQTPPVNDDRSVRRPLVLGLADLDAMEEDRY